MEGDDHDLLERPWTPVCIGGSQLLAKTWFGDTAYHILLTDLHSVWEERMGSITIQDRAQELNKRLRAPVHAFFSHLCKVALPCLSGQRDGGTEVEEGGSVGEAHISLSHQGGDITMKLKSELAGLPFHWEFRCSPAPTALVCSQLVRPLLVMTRLMQRQVDQLVVLLHSKDIEIQDYRENGAELSRERLQTDAFEEHSYREKFVTQVLPQVCAQQEGFGFNPELQQLYATVTTHSSTKTRERMLSELHAQEPAQNQDPEHGPSNTPPLGNRAVGGEPSQAEGGPPGPRVEAGATAPKRPPPTQSGPYAAASSDRPPSRKKKKAGGLFR